MPTKWYSIELNSTKYNIKKNTGKGVAIGANVYLLGCKNTSKYESLNMGGEYGTRLGACLGNIDQFGGL